jgi:hypothetical protein
LRKDNYYYSISMIVDSEEDAISGAFGPKVALKGIDDGRARSSLLLSMISTVDMGGL